MNRILPALSGDIRAVVCAALLAATSPLGAQATPPAAPIPPASAIDTSYVNYDEGPVSLPLGIGIRVPGYNRVDGFVLPWGPMISLAQDRIRIDPTITYRSNIGKIDPFVKMSFKDTGGIGFELAGGRSTFTNDDWIRSDFINSLATLGVGSDSRNYYRADRGWALLSYETTHSGFVTTPSVGVLTENDWSTGSPVRHTNAPWSFFGKTDSLKMRRPNPAIARGHITSGFAHLITEYAVDAVKASLDVGVEHAFKTPPKIVVVDNSPVGFANTSALDVITTTGPFTQITIGSKASFPTFGTQHFDFRGRAVFTPGDIAPPQRFAYLGGAGTLATVDLLALGGDRLFYVEGEYSVPIEQIVLPIVGNPIVSARYAAGAAGIGKLPDFIQNIGVGLGVRFLKAEYHIDPNYKKTTFSRKHAFSIGISLSL
jgi:hypothetical protein